MTNEAAEKALAHYNALAVELASLRKESRALATRAKEVDARIGQLAQGFNHPGLVAIAKTDAELARFPVYAQGGQEWHTQRVVNANDKWITIRSGHASPVRYRRSDGGKEGTRATTYYKQTIDVEKALACWNDWLNKYGNPNEASPCTTPSPES